MIEIYISAWSYPFRKWLRNQWKWHIDGLWTPIFRTLLRVLIRGYVNGKDNKIKIALGEIKSLRLQIDGDENFVSIGKGCYIQNVRVFLRGNRSVLHVGDSVRLVNTDIYLCGDACLVSIGMRTSVQGAKFAAAESETRLGIGNFCMLSEGIEIRTGDSHGIYNSKGVRTNLGKDVEIADRVWIGKNVMILKGTCVAQNCIIGASSLVSGKFTSPGCIIAGNPALVKRENIFWRRDLVEYGGPHLNHHIS